MIYFTSDTHFYHKNILKYQDRPFSSISEMNDALVANWNSIVKDTDEIYILGDFSFGTAEETINLLDKLNGKKFLVKGNHDLILKNPSVVNKFEWVKDYHILKINKVKYILFHFPIFSWDTKFHGSIHLYGHTHGNEIFNEPNSFNVGVDVNNFYPVSLTHITKILNGSSNN